MTTRDPRPLLFTPGPLTTSDGVRAAMDEDWGSRNPDFIELTVSVQSRILSLLQAPEDMACVLLQGSGTFAVEAMIDTLVPPHTSRTLVLVNGTYGQRIADILARQEKTFDVLVSKETEPTPIDQVAAKLAQGTPAYSHAVIVHCETTSGVINPLESVADLCTRHGVTLLVDAMSSLGCLDIPLEHPAIGATAASANKCLQGVPGVCFVLVREADIQQASGNARSLVLDLSDQWGGFVKNGQWRFTPPVQVVAALDAALAELEFEGGIAARRDRYQSNCNAIVSGMAELGYQALLEPSHQAPVIVTFPLDEELADQFDLIQSQLAAQSISIYPGKLTHGPSLRIGCIGDIDKDDIERLMSALKQTLKPVG